MTIFADTQLQAGSGAATAVNYIEDVFSTYLYTGTGNGQNINNNIALQTTPSFVAYSKQGLGGGISSDSFTSQAGDILVACSVNITTSPTLTVNSVARTASSTLTDTYGYFNNVYIVSLSAGTTTYSFTGGSGNYNIFVVRGASSVAVSAGLSETTGASLTTTSFSSAGFGLVYVNDRDAYTSITPAAGSYTVTQAQATFFVSKISTINGNGTTVPATTISGLDATYRSVYCTFNVLGLSSSVATTAGYGGMVWIKDRAAAFSNFLADTERGPIKFISSDSTNGQSVDIGLQAFTANGFQVGGGNYTNTITDNMVSWTFRKQAKFFDVVTYTGTGSARTIAHNLGSTPGCVIVKRTDTTGNWQVYHNGLTSAAYAVQLNSSAAQASDTTIWNSTAPTSTVFSVGTNTTVNASGGTYVAYLFASNAGGFGSAGTDNVIACGSVTQNGSGNASVNLGWEPQWVLFKRYDTSGSWQLLDTMRGLLASNVLGSNTVDAWLNPENTNPEGSIGSIGLTATGFNNYGAAIGASYLYIAIRRGPMKTPTSGTSVFNPTKTGGGVATVTTNFAPDSVFFTDNFRSVGSGNPNSQSNPVIDKLRGPLLTLSTMAANGDQTQTSGVVFNNTGFVESLENSWSVANDCTYWSFVRAPQFFDEVCYTGTGAATTVTHNLGAVPELIFVKQRSAANSWWVYNSTLGNTKYTLLNSAAAPTTSATAWNNTTPTASVFTVGTAANVNGSGSTYIAYLFATLAGVSKVGTYTGTGSTTQTINCGFPSGVRFVLIKRTDVTGDWYCFDTANGMTSSSSPYLLWDSGAAQTTGNNGCYSAATGFTLTSAAAATVNVNTGTYIYLAIA